MKPGYVSITLAVAILFVGGYATFLQVRPQTYPQGQSGEGKADGLVLKLWADKSVYAVGEPVVIGAQLTNTASQPFPYSVGTPCSLDLAIYVNTTNGLQDITSSLQEPTPCIQVIQERTVEPGEVIRQNASWDQLIRFTTGSLQAPAGTYVISARFPGALWQNVSVQVSIAITISGQAARFLDAGEALTIAVNNPQVSSWFHAHQGSNLVKEVDAAFCVLMDDRWVTASKEVADQVRAQVPGNSTLPTILEGRATWQVSFFEKLGAPPHEVRVYLDLDSGRILDIKFQ